MIRYILDTDILSLLQRRHLAVSRRVEERKDETAISVFTIEEQLSGWYALLRKALKPDQQIVAYRSLSENVRFLSQLAIIDYDAPALERYEDLKRAKLKIGKTDLRIAAVVIEAGATLVTRNLADFSRVPGLSFEDWSK